MSLVNVAPNCVMTSTTSLWGWFRLTVNLSLSQLCISNLCWCKTSSGTLLSPLFEFEFLLLIWLFKLALRGLNPGRFNCKWLTLLYSTKNRWTWCDKPWTKLTSLALPLWPNCLEFRKKKNEFWRVQQYCLHFQIMILCMYFAQNRDCILKSTNLALSLWPNYQEFDLKFVKEWVMKSPKILLRLQISPIDTDFK